MKTDFLSDLLSSMTRLLSEIRPGIRSVRTEIRRDLFLNVLFLFIQ